MNRIAFLLLAGAAVMTAQKKDFVYRTGGGVPGDGPVKAAIVGVELGGPTVTGAPYSADAVTESTQTLADGNRIVSKTTSKIYRDSAGRERREQPFPKIAALTKVQDIPMSVVISDPVAKVTYTLEGKSAIKMPAGGFAFATGTTRVSVAGIAMAPGDKQVITYSDSGMGLNKNAKTEDLGSQLIGGVQATGTRTTTTIPAGQIGNERAIEVVSERWYSPELQVVVMSRFSDPRAGETVYQLSNLSRVEPDTSLFQVPAGFAVKDLSAGPEGGFQVQVKTKKDGF
jgi:hypothetical protein